MIERVTATDSENTSSTCLASNDGLMDSAWPMKCHDTKHSSRSPYSTSDNSGALLWKFRSDKWIEGGVVVDDEGVVYFGDYWGTLYAVYPDGTLKWRYKTGGTIWSSPAIGCDGTVYVGSWDHCLHAVNPDGSRKWKFWAGDTASITSSPVIGDDGTIYFGAMGPNKPSVKGRVYALNPDGTEKWHYDTGDWITSDPALGEDGTLYIGSTDTYLYAINPNGTLKWRYKTDHYVKGPPSIGDDGTIYFGSYDDYLYALYPNGTLKWKCKVGHGTETNPSIGPDGTIYVGGDKLYAVNPDGTIKWSFNLGRGQHIHQSSPAVSSDGIIYVGTNIGETSGGDIIAINPDGTERWRRRIADAWVDSSPCIGQNGIVYIGSSSKNRSSGESFGYLYAFGSGSVPPDTPSISGPRVGRVMERYNYSICSVDGNLDDIYYFVDWGDNTSSGWLGSYPSGYTIELGHTWSSEGSYTIKAKARDTMGLESDWGSFKVTISTDNPPGEPVIHGNKVGRCGVSYYYSFKSFDPEGDGIYYYVDWGDGSSTGWTGPYGSGREVTLKHTWDKKGTYTIRAKARDTFGLESDWSTLEVSMPRNNKIDIVVSWLIRYLQLRDYLVDKPLNPYIRKGIP